MPNFIDDEKTTPCRGGICEAWAEDFDEIESSLPNCPRCNEEIRILQTKRLATVIGKVAYNYDTECIEDVEPEIIFKPEEEIDDNNFIVFICPFCKAPIFDSPESVDQFFYDHKMLEEEEIEAPYKS